MVSVLHLVMEAGVCGWCRCCIRWLGYGGGVGGLMVAMAAAMIVVEVVVSVVAMVATESQRW